MSSIPSSLNGGGLPGCCQSLFLLKFFSKYWGSANHKFINVYKRRKKENKTCE